MPRIVEIYTAEIAGAPMKRRGAVSAERGGIKSDRYRKGVGAWSRSKPPKIRDITLIAADAIEGSGFTSEQTRRNLVVEGISPDELNALKGHVFNVGNVRMRGTELADPCQRPSKLSGIPGFPEKFAGKGGLRAEVLTPGRIRIGSKLQKMNY